MEGPFRRAFGEPVGMLCWPPRRRPRTSTLELISPLSLRATGSSGAWGVSLIVNSTHHAVRRKILIVIKQAKQVGSMSATARGASVGHRTRGCQTGHRRRTMQGGCSRPLYHAHRRQGRAQEGGIACAQLTLGVAAPALKGGLHITQTLAGRRTQVVALLAQRTAVRPVEPLGPAVGWEAGDRAPRRGAGGGHVSRGNVGVRVPHHASRHTHYAPAHAHG